MSRASSDLVALFDVDVTGDTLPDPSWNIAPTDSVRLLVDTRPQQESADPLPVRRLAAARWGLIPAWANDPRSGARAFNARIETAAEKPTFREAVRSRRAVIPASGYYEWAAGADGAKTPHLVQLPDDELMLFAGLYEWWRDPALDPTDPARWILSTTILTRAAHGPLSDLHDRMPVLIGADLMDEWLDPETVGDDSLLQGVSEESLQHAERAGFHPVAAVGVPE